MKMIADKEEMKRSLKEVQENMIKQVKGMNKTIQDLKMGGGGSNKENTNCRNPGEGKPREENRNYRCKHQPTEYRSWKRV